MAIRATHRVPQFRDFLHVKQLARVVMNTANENQSNFILVLQDGLPPDIA